MASEVGHEIFESDKNEPNIPDQNLAKAEVNGLEDEPLIVYREAGPVTLDIPQALLEGVTYRTPVQYRDLITHGDDEEERGDNAHVVSPLALQMDMDKPDKDIRDILNIVSFNSSNPTVVFF